jgi:hypothetical protein
MRFSNANPRRESASITAFSTGDHHIDVARLVRLGHVEGRRAATDDHRVDPERPQRRRDSAGDIRERRLLVNHSALPARRGR